MNVAQTDYEKDFTEFEDTSDSVLSHVWKKKISSQDIIRAREIQSHLALYTASSELTYDDMVVLYLISIEQCTTHKEVYAYEGFSKTKASQTLRRLYKFGLVGERISDVDARKNVLHITRSGQNILLGFRKQFPRDDLEVIQGFHHTLSTIAQMIHIPLSRNTRCVVLYLLVCSHPQKVREIANALKLPNSTLSGILAHLREYRLISIVSGRDKREKLIQINLNKLG